MISTFRYVEYFAVRMLLCVMGGIPYRASLRLGSVLGKLAYAVCGGLRHRTLDNLRSAYGTGMSAGRLDQVSRSVFDVLGRNVAEVASLAFRPFQGLKVLDSQILRDAYDRGRGVVLVSAHMGCFSRMVAVPRLLGMKGAAIMKRQRNSMLLDWARGMLKRRFNLDVILKTDATEEVQAHLQSGSLVGFFADQHPRTGGYTADFFGRPVEVAPGPAIFAKRYKSPMVVLTCVSLPDGSHAVQCDGPVDPVGSLEEMTRRWMSIVESRIREHPEQWMWMHRRWR